MKEPSGLAFPYLRELTSADLVSLLAEYVRTPTLADADTEFIEAIQEELKTRKDV